MKYDRKNEGILKNEGSINEENINQPIDKEDFRNMSTIQIMKRISVLTIVATFVFVAFYETVGVLGLAFQKEDQKIIVDNVDGYEFVHYMTNNVISAKDGMKWGFVEINNKNIEKAINYFKDEDSVVIEELIKWKDGDFSNSDYLHNYVWEKLQGDFGEAIEVDYIGVDIALYNLQE